MSDTAEILKAIRESEQRLSDQMSEMDRRLSAQIRALSKTLLSDSERDADGTPKVVTNIAPVRRTVAP
ncbi:MAG TPA: hypothetical protein VI299_03860 [Polyangiales bacterium]